MIANVTDAIVVIREQDRKIASLESRLAKAVGALRKIDVAFKDLEAGDYEGYCAHEVGVCFMQSKELHEALTDIWRRDEEEG